MNLSLPFFDAAAAPLPLPQAGGGTALPGGPGLPTLGGRAEGGPRETSGARPPDATAGQALAAAAADFAAALAADAAGAAVHDPLAGAPPAPIADARQRATLHAGVWRASQLGAAPLHTRPSGFEALDAQLPGGGWPHGMLTELLLPQPGVGELRLLAPALAAAPASARCVMLFDPPAQLSAWALLQGGLDSRHWLVVRSRGSAPGRAAPRGARRVAPLLPGADVLWALEQALRSGQVGAVLAWLPLQLRADALRRLQLAAQSHDGPAFVFRDAVARTQPSPAPLRLLLQPAGVDELLLRLLKRRGPPLAQPLRLLLPSALTPQQLAQAQASLALQDAVQGASTQAQARAGVAPG